VPLEPSSKSVSTSILPVSSNIGFTCCSSNIADFSSVATSVEHADAVEEGADAARNEEGEEEAEDAERDEFGEEEVEEVSTSS
jgi:hypothetical protein